MSTFKQINLNKVKRYSIQKRKHKVSLKNLLYFNPNYQLDKNKLSKKFQDLARLIKQARAKSKPIIFGMGGHVIKTGMGPLIVKLIENKFITCLSGNGAVAIHDFELAAFGKTSEYVENNLPKGKFGFVVETNKIFHKALKIGSEQKLGLGESLGKYVK